ncbi:hypothetical protein Vretimale_13251 [Volvox reticuliferus]|uniref:Peptidase S49 domain-containing protein n=3 Tax=Volvox reticuliferus TaxID=1737510 RepID=A0A8J4GL17_9CHLO|nr:hypothetical protein Vretimale_13251 [Volvox reticuliferus]
MQLVMTITSHNFKRISHEWFYFVFKLLSLSDPKMSRSRAFTLLSSIRKGVGTGLAFAGAGALLSSALLVAARYRASQADAQLPSEFVLEVPLDRLRVVDAINASPLAVLTGDINQVELPQVVSALRNAAKDERCQGVVAYIGPREHLGGLASVQELRDAILSFRAAATGRSVTTAAFAASFGEAGSSGMVPYVLATACERLYMQPSGMVGLTGLESRSFFARALLDRVHAKPLILAREEYKSAANFLTKSGFTEAQRANVTNLLGDMAGQMVAAMGTARGVEVEAVRKAMDAAPLLPAAATAAKLLDGTKYKDEVQALFRISDKALGEEKVRLGSKHKRRKDDVRMARVPLDKYIRLMELKKASAAASKEGLAGWLKGTPFQGLALLLTGKDSESRQRRKVAVVTASGPIVQGPVRPGPSQGQVIDATKLCRHLGALLEDPEVTAVVVRVNSPGGSALASDTLHHELMRLRAAGKPVVVSMGDVAASGGYYLAAAADRIVAQPGTLTGSIGVLFGKVNISKTLEEVGVCSDAVTVGRNADALSPFTDFTDAQEAQLEVMIDHVYQDFLDKVSRSRGRPVAEIRQLAKGKVYTGLQAHDVGLVDELGGLETAVQRAKQLAGLPEDAEVVSYPPRRVPLLLQLLRRSMPQPDDGDGGSGPAAVSAQQLAEAVLPGPGWESLGAALAAMRYGVSHSGATAGAAAVAAAVASSSGGGGGGAISPLGPGTEAGIAAVGAQVGGSLGLLLGGEPQLYSVEAAVMSRV